MIPAAFEYVRPKSLASAIERLEADPDGSKLLAGGHTLIPTLKLRLASPSVLIDLNGIAELRGIGIDRDRIKIGALTTHADLLSSDELHKTLPIFREAATVIADPQVRNRGTIGGSLANADPAADWPAIAIALQAELDIAGPKGSRRLAARDFFIDIFTTALEPCEVLTGIHVKRTDPNTRFSYRKICHPASGYAVVGIATALRMDRTVVGELLIGVTGAAQHAFEGTVAAEFLRGKPLSRENIDEAARLLTGSSTYLSDHYASAEYRENLLKVEMRRALLGFLT